MGEAKLKLSTMVSRVHALGVENTRLRDQLDELRRRQAPLVALLTEVSLLLGCETPADCRDVVGLHKAITKVGKGEFTLNVLQYCATIQALAEAQEVVDG